MEAKDKKTHHNKTAPGAPEVSEEELADEAETKKGAASHEDSTSGKKADADDKKTEKSALDDEQTSEAVEDIIRKEGDELLESQDKDGDKTVNAPPKHSRRKRVIWSVIVVLLVAAAVLMAVPVTRYVILNTLGVRASASVHVIDNTTQQPLKNVNVKVGEVTAKTDSDGNATLDKLKLGTQELTIERIAFDGVKKDVTIGWGSNPLGEYKLTAVGVQYTFFVRDELSGQPIEGAEVSSGEAAARADKDGKAILTIEDTDAQEVPVTVAANGYRSTDLKLKIDTTDAVNVTLTTSSKAVFVARENGRYNVYGMDIDGRNKKLLLEGTGNETGNIALAVSPDGQQAALVSVRGEEKSNDGFLLSTLTLIEVSSGEATARDVGEQVQPIDWVGTKLIYQVAQAEETADSSERQRLMSYDYSSDTRTQLAAANKFEVVASAQGKVYFAPAAKDEKGGSLMRVNPDGGDKKTVLDKEVWSAYRTAYGTLTLQASDGWYQLVLGSDTSSSAGAPGSPLSRVYIDNQAGTRSLWVDNGTLKTYDIAENKDTNVRSQSGVAYPVRWLTNTTAVYRVVTGQEVADYVVSTGGGEARKVAGVTNTFGLTQTY